MIFITGDTHGDVNFAKMVNLSLEHRNLTKKDYVIVLGDFTALGRKEAFDTALSLYKKLPYTVLFIDGNHEHFDYLDDYSVQEWNGGKVHKLANNVIHLMRGQVFKIDGMSFFTFGGATSIDKDYRVKGFTWFKEEMPTQKDLEEAKHNLSKVKNSVDFVLTHSCDVATFKEVVKNAKHIIDLVCDDNRMINYFEENVSYQHWFFGHYHIDLKINENKTCLFNNIIRLN